MPLTTRPVNMSSGFSSQRDTKPKPLQASTNIIHTKIPRYNAHKLKLSINQNKQNIIEPSKGKTNTNHKAKQSDLKKKLPSKKSTTDENELGNEGTLSTVKTEKKTDENDVGPINDPDDVDDDYAFAKDPYNPQDHIHVFDDELYQKILKLELADDGLPVWESDEPFDF